MRKADVIIPTFKPGDKLEKTSAAAVGTECAGGPCDHHEYGRKVLGC